MEVTRIEQRIYIKIDVLRRRNAMECPSELVTFHRISPSELCTSGSPWEYCPIIPYSSAVGRSRKISILAERRGRADRKTNQEIKSNHWEVVLQARRNRRQTAGEIARHTTQATGRPISRFTVARRLHGGDLFARRPVRCVPLTPAHRRRHSLWCREHRNWRENEWERVLFADESRFSLSSDSHRILIWRERGSRNHPSNII
ncbi:transposable element Tcb1 transposase [Trichonephila clavipes]|nr:transposable element Tcb1 transposase [Trichonephila clavipes]